MLRGALGTIKLYLEVVVFYIFARSLVISFSRTIAFLRSLEMVLLQSFAYFYRRLLVIVVY